MKTIKLRKSCLLEVGCLDHGRPSYRWVQGWVYTTPRGAECQPLRLNEAIQLAKQDYPGFRVTLDTSQN